MRTAVSDRQVKQLWPLAQNLSVEAAAAKSGMDSKTARKWQCRNPAPPSAGVNRDEQRSISATALFWRNHYFVCPLVFGTASGIEIWRRSWLNGAWTLITLQSPARFCISARCWNT